MEIWIRPTGHPGTSRPTGSESGKDSEQDGELVTLSPSDVSAYENMLNLFEVILHQYGMEIFRLLLKLKCHHC